MPGEGLGAFHKLHIDRDLDFQHVHAISIVGELRHALGHDLRFLLGVFEALFVDALLVSHQLEEERDIVSAALVADALYPGMLDVVDLVAIGGRVVKQDLEGVSAGLFQPLHRPVIQQIGQPAGFGLVIAGLFIGEQQARVFAAGLGSRQAPLGIEQDGAGVLREHLADNDLEFLQLGIRNLRALFLGQSLLQRAALVHSSGGDDAALIRDVLQSGELPRRELHSSSHCMMMK